MNPSFQMTYRLVAPALITALVSCASAARSVFAAEAAGDAPPIVHFHVVQEAAIYRGARPEVAGLVALAKLGVRTDLDLDDDARAGGAEAQLAESLGVHYISHPMSGFWSPHDEVVNAALAILSDPAQYPVYVHCLHGQDRTGVVVGLHRVFEEKWTAQNAYDEMREIGFHPALFLLERYFWDRANGV